MRRRASDVTRQRAHLEGRSPLENRLTERAETKKHGISLSDVRELEQESARLTRSIERIAL
jgi:hypothetical protein